MNALASWHAPTDTNLHFVIRSLKCAGRYALFDTHTRAEAHLGVRQNLLQTQPSNCRVHADTSDQHRTHARDEKVTC
eukprot:5061214-Pleurochrysis_carterae.AAC.1